MAWAALGRVDAGLLISHRFPLARAAEAYALLDGAEAGRTPVLQVLLLHD